MSSHFSQEITSFHGRKPPEAGVLAGYARIIVIIEKKSGKTVPLPERLALVTQKHQRYDTAQWQVFTKRHRPGDDIASHLVFALKYEGIDLYILKSLFEITGEDVVLGMIRTEPTSQYTRRIWFLYEWLMRTKLDTPDLKTGNYIEIVDTKYQYAASPVNSSRHRVKNNLPGTPDFCPMIRRTEALEGFISKDFAAGIEKDLGGRDRELLRRTAAFLLLKDSKASFAIEGEYPSESRARNWGRALGEAGKKELTIGEIERLQEIMIGAKKLKHMGLRKDEGFIGEHDRETFAPIPDHISAKADDLISLMRGLLETDTLLRSSGYDPVLTAATIAFGFVFIHPLTDGNGRIHRYLIHHILANSGFARKELFFPVSAAILDRIGDYREVLESYTAPRLGMIEWEPTMTRNVRILNETADLYRYGDFTRQAEFLYACVENTIEDIIPEELEYLRRYDQLSRFINLHVTLPDTRVDLLIKFLIQNEGNLSESRRKKEFDELTDGEIQRIEEEFAEIYFPTTH